MKLTPLDVRKQEFRKTLRGFDPIEVQTFLEMVAEEYERVLEDNKRLNRREIELETKLKDYQETERNLRETLLNVQEVKKQSEESSRRQADLIIKESELKALEIIELARKQARQMRDDVSVLRTQKESFINRLRQILISQIELLSVLEIDEAIPEEAHEYVENAQARKKKRLKTETDKPALMEKNKGNPQGEGVEKKSSGNSPVVDSSEKSNSDSDDSNDDEDEESQMVLFNNIKDTDGKESSLKKTKNKENDEINEIFKKGIQIDELIKNLDKKQKK